MLVDNQLNFEVAMGKLKQMRGVFFKSCVLQYVVQRKCV